MKLLYIARLLNELLVELIYSDNVNSDSILTVS